MAMTAGAIRAGRAYVEIFADDSKLSRDLRRAAGQLDRFGSQVQGIGSKLMGTAAAASVPIVASLRVFTEFSDQMQEVKAITGATGDEFARLNEQAKQLGAVTSFEAFQAAGGQAELGRAGFDVSEIIAATPHVLALARAANREIPEAAGIAAAALRQFGLATEETQRVTDRLLYTANNSYNDLTTVGEALKYAGPVAADLNMTLEDTLAIIGALGNIGIQGSMAGTTIKRLSVISAAEAEKLEAIFGRSFRGAGGAAMPMLDVLEQINDATASLGTADRTAKLNEAFGLLGITGASAIGRAAGSVRELRDNMLAADGVAQKTAATMDEELGGSVRITISSIKSVAIAIGESLAPAAKDLLAGVQSVASATRQWIEDNKELAVQIVKGIAVIGAAGAGLFAFATGVKIAAFALGGLTTAAQASAGAMALLTGQTQLTGVALIAAKAGMLAAAAAAGYGLGTAIVRLTGIYGDLNGELRKASGLFDVLAKKRSVRQTAEIAAAVALATPTDTTPGDATAARAALREQLSRAETNQASIDQAVIDQRTRVNNVEPGLFGNDLLEVEQRQLTELEMQAVDQKALIESIKAALSEVDAIEAQQQAQQKLQEFQAQQLEAAKVDLKPIEERVAGTFSGRALDRMSAAGMIRYAQETAHNTAKMVDGIADVAVAVSNLQQNWGT